MTSTVFSLSLLALSAICVGVLLSPMMQSVFSAPSALDGGLPDETFQVAGAPSAPPPVLPAAPQILASATPPASSAAPVQRVATPASATALKIQKATVRTARAAKPSTAAPTKPEPQPENLERQKQDYAQARAAYDASERKEGRRWAEQNRIRVERHCRAAEQRNAAFVEGCLAFVRSGRTASLD